LLLDKRLSHLNHQERELVYRSPLLVCVLIAGADGRIDDAEVKEALQMARDQTWVKSSLKSFFNEIATDFEDKLKVIIQSYPFESKKRTPLIIAELEQLNLLWTKLDREFAASYLDMLRYLAKKIASSSGSFWRKIADEEADLLGLPMLQDPTKK
jgi:hypothetical protein